MPTTKVQLLNGRFAQVGLRFWNLNSFLCTPWRRVGNFRVSSTPLESKLDWGQWSASHPNAYVQGKNPPASIKKEDVCTPAQELTLRLGTEIGLFERLNRIPVIQRTESSSLLEPKFCEFYMSLSEMMEKITCPSPPPPPRHRMLVVVVAVARC